MVCKSPVGYLCLLNDCEISSFSLSPSLAPFLFKSAFPPQPCYPQVPLQSSISTLSFSSQPLLSFLAPWSPLLIFLPPSFFFPPSCEIAVVSYGFLFLRDGRWVHVGVEATKHAVSARRAGQHTQRASCGYDSCHVHISVLPIIKNVHAVKIEQA